MGISPIHFLFLNIIHILSKDLPKVQRINKTQVFESAVDIDNPETTLSNNNLHPAIEEHID